MLGQHWCGLSSFQCVAVVIAGIILWITWQLPTVSNVLCVKAHIVKRFRAAQATCPVDPRQDTSAPHVGGVWALAVCLVLVCDASRSHLTAVDAVVSSKQKRTSVHECQAFSCYRAFDGVKQLVVHASHPQLSADMRFVV